MITQERGLYSRSPTNLSGGKDESFKYNVPTLIAGSQKAGLLGGSGTLPPAVSEILNQEDAIIVVVRVEEDSDETKMRQNVVNGLTHC